MKKETFEKYLIIGGKIVLVLLGLFLITNGYDYYIYVTSAGGCVNFFGVDTPCTGIHGIFMIGGGIILLSSILIYEIWKRCD